MYEELLNQHLQRDCVTFHVILRFMYVGEIRDRINLKSNWVTVTRINVFFIRNFL